MSTAMAQLGLSHISVESEPVMIQTLRANGHPTWHADVTSSRVRDHPWPAIYLFHASPPCQSFSVSGRGEGRAHLDSMAQALRKVADGALPEDALASVADDALDKRTELSLEPMLVIQRHRPRFITLEQVPPVLPLWEAYAEILRGWGYSAWTGMLHSEQFGVPQTRKRAVLMASRERQVSPPAPTHSRFHSRSPERLDDGLLPWVSMARALDWGMTARPAMTVTGGGSATGGAEPFGNAARQTIRREEEEGRWVQRSNYSASGKPGQTAEERGRTERELGHPSVVITSKGFRWKAKNDAVRVTVEEAATLQTFPEGYEFCGNKGEQFQQVGNAYPPVMALAILTALTCSAAPQR
jgi:DNA (cytosine-5)-methyltransferase 1